MKTLVFLNLNSVGEHKNVLARNDFKFYWAL